MEFDRETRRRGNGYHSRSNSGYRYDCFSSGYGLNTQEHRKRSASACPRRRKESLTCRFATRREDGREFCSGRCCDQGRVCKGDVAAGRLQRKEEEVVVVAALDGCTQKKEKEDVVVNGLVKEQCNSDFGGKLTTHVQRYVSFYFTNFPPLLSNFFLRKGFEVCGILEDVYVAKKKNKYGEPYGFVRFSNVKNVPKLTKALNDVWFGNYRVRASVALFDRYNSGEVGGHDFIKDGKPKRVDQIPTKNGSKVLRQPAVMKGNEGIMVEQKIPREKEDSGHLDSVHVGDIVVKVGAGQKRVARKDARKKGGNEKHRGGEA
ncbi:RNA recognition motif [Trifolium pratense]|uniref:RNA recognition motif n=1 Tax=Trifolium pratense TaxID=57577 RepID=A0A2K3LYI5_TRIPR|nr:RNA recognition motif [Trifolium pratense]